MFRENVDPVFAGSLLKDFYLLGSKARRGRIIQCTSNIQMKISVMFDQMQGQCSSPRGDNDKILVKSLILNIHRVNLQKYDQY